MIHLSTEQLRRWRDGEDESIREQIVGHLASCDECSARYAELIRTRPLDTHPAAPARFEPAEFVARGDRLLDVRPPRLWGLPRWAPALGAAAVLVLSVGYLLLPDVSDQETVYRGAEAGVELVRPIDSRVAAANLVFEWKAGEPLGRFRLRVIDLAAPDKPLIDRENVASGYRPTDAERQQFRSGVTYRWFVEFRSASGGVDTSPAGRFEIE